MSLFVALMLAQPILSPAIDYRQAIGTVSRRVPGFVVEAKLENEQELVVWNVTVMPRANQFREVTLSAESGRILEVTTEDSDRWRETRPARVRMSALRAAEIALKYRGGEVREIELDREDGRLEWDVYVLSAVDRELYEVSLDARSGAFRRIEKESDASSGK